MIEINLLPAEKRKRLKKPLSFELEPLKGKLVPIACGAVGLLLVTYLIIWLAVGIKSHSLQVLNKRWDEIQPQKKEAEMLKAQTEDLGAKTGILNDLLTRQFLWSEKLNQLSDSMISGVWLTRLSVEQKSMEVHGKAPVSKSSRKKVEEVQTILKRALVLRGSAITLEEEATATVGKFMKSLRENEDFFKDFEKIELGTIRSRKIKDVEVMDFSLECYFKEGSFEI